MDLKTPYYATGIREQYRTRFPLLNAIITHYTAKPLPQQTPYWTPNAERAFWISFSLLIATPLAVWLLSAVSFTLAVIASYFAAVLMTGLFRKFQVEYGHHASHRTFVRGDRAKNALYLNLSTSIAFSQNGHEYRKEHNEHHDRAIFTTDADADAALLRHFGIRPGRSRQRLWLQLAMTVFSPRFHLYFMGQRLKSGFVTRQPWQWRIASALWLAFLVSTFFVLPTWIAVVTIWLPLPLFYQMSVLIQFVTEHGWMMSQAAPADTHSYAKRCWGRFMGEPLPANLAGWPGFVLRHLFLHFPGRYAIVVGDMPAHDWHHLAGYLGVQGHKWPAGIYERQRAIENGDELRMADRELWGIVAALNHIFLLLERVPARQVDVAISHASLAAE